MKITFSNLGAIKKTTLDLRPLTVIIGPNNSNKTYIAYSIYGILNYLRTNLSVPIHGLFTDRIADSEFWFEIDDIFKFLKEDFQENLVSFKKELREFFQDSSGRLFNLTEFDIKSNKLELLNTLDRLIISTDTEFTKGFGFTLKDERLYVDFKENLIRKGIISIEDEFNVTRRVIWQLKFLATQRPFLLPAERNAFVITYKVLARNRLKHLRFIERERYSARSLREQELLREQGMISYPQPIEDFLDFLTDVEFEIDSNNSEEGKKFCDLADEIENSLQGKNKTNFQSTRLGGKEIKINVKKGLDIDLYNASSSIKQLAPLLLYLRYRAREGDLLIIDEPEMNLHPESQAKLLEVLAMLVNAGVNVLLTTHSPYFMSHLNNLIAGDMKDEGTRKKQAKSLYLNDETAFLSPDDVSAYEMRQSKNGNVRLHDLKEKLDEGYGISWGTLSDVSADIQQKFFEIYEKSHELAEED